MNLTSKPSEVYRMIEIRNNKLVIDGYAIGGEEEIMAILGKARDYDKLKSDFGGDLNE